MDADPCGPGPHPVSDAVSSACSGLGGRLLTCYSPFRHWAPEGPVRLACLIHAASVHSEPGSNSPSLKSPCAPPNGAASCRFNFLFKRISSGGSPVRRTGNPSIKNHVRSYCAARFPKSGRTEAALMCHADYFTSFSAFCKARKMIFSEKAIRKKLEQYFILSKRTLFIPFYKNSMNSF